MPEILTESFCERCGTRYTFETAAPKAGRLGRFKTLSSGLKNYVLSDDASLDEALAAARNDDDRRTSSEQLDAFHKTFNFCMSCRQYTCSNCWNEPEGRCLTCAPNLGREVLPAPFPTLEPTVGLIGAAAGNGNGNGHAISNGSGPVTIDANSWPTVDLGESAAAAAATGLAADAATTTDLDDSGLAPVSRLEAIFGIAPEPRPADEPDAPFAAEATAEPVVDALAVAGTAAAAEPSTDTSDWLSGEPGSDEVLIGDVSATERPADAAVEPIATEAETPAEPEPISVEALLAGAASAALVEPMEVEPAPVTDAIAGPVAAEQTDTTEELAAAATLVEPEPPVDDPHRIAAAAGLAIAAEAAMAASEPETAQPAPEPTDRDSLFPSQTRSAYSVEGEQLFAPHVEPAYSVEAESLFPTQPAGWPASAAQTTPPPSLAPAASATPAPSYVPPVEPTGPPAIPSPAAVPPQPIAPNATDERAAAAAGNTSTILRRFQASRPAAGLIVPAAVAADAARDEVPTDQPAPPEQVLATSPDPAVTAAPEVVATEVPQPPAVPETPSRPQVDEVGTPVWHMVAPEAAVAPQAPAPGPTAATPAKTNGHDHGAEPQWPAAPAWPASTAPRPAPTGADAIWAQSSRDVLNRPGPAGVQACLNCGLPLSSTARFCRRCGSSQVSA
jgi:hypothetical protein